MGVANKIKLNSFDSLFNANMTDSGTEEIKIDLLCSFKDHPFKVIDDEHMENLIESIRENGVLNPVIVRKTDTENYEIISGHRRVHACKALNMSTVPVIVKELSDDEAIILMVDSNIQREEILPSEKAFSYKMKLDASKRQGKRTDLTSSQVGTKLRADEQLAQETGESRNQIQRYIRLTQLNKELLEMVDCKKIPLNTAYELSFLSEEEQLVLLEKMEEYSIIPSIKHALKLKFYSAHSKGKKLTADICSYILQEEIEKPKNVSLKAKTLKEYFPESYTSEQMEDVILVLLKEWASKNKTEE